MRLVFDRYEYDRSNIIGQGGMGTVYRGTDTQTHSAIAIKYLHPDFVRSNPSMVERFRREGEALRELNHPNIVKMLDAGQCGDEHYLIMEFVNGGSLRDLLDSHKKLIVQRALYIALDLADALTRAHRLEILHRDIKPANVLIADDGTPRLTDFGVARVHTSNMTAEGTLIGTLAYLSPESLTGGTLDERHDIWAFGVMLYEMLTGTRPFASDMVAPLITEITTQPIPDLESIRPDIPIALVDLIYRMLQKDPDQRIRSVRVVGAELEAIIHSNDTGFNFGPTTSAARFRTTTTSVNTVDANTSDMFTANSGNRLYNFPVEATPFVGRNRELNDLRVLLEDPTRRLITLVGPGGIGKTRIAQAAAAAAVDLFPDGIYFASMESVSVPEHVPSKLAESLGMQLSGRDPKMELMNFLREKHAMLVMDNMEQLVQGANMLSENMEKMPNITLLVTSRERLRLRGEQVYEIDSMIVPPSEETNPEALMEYPAVRLFLNSAERTGAVFELNAETIPQVARIIGLVQGVPLGIELAAGWLEILSIDEIAQEIEDSLDFLETDIRDVPERHRSLRAVFDHSWNLMNEDERDAFMKLAIFRDGFERSAAQKIMGTSLRTLTALVNKSLLFRDPDGRYVVHKILRQYAHERFTEHCTKGDEVYDSYIRYYARFMQTAQEMFGTKRERQATEAIETELENIRHAWTLAQNRLNLEALDHMLESFNLYHIARSTLSEALMQYQETANGLAANGHGQDRFYYRLQNRYAQVLGRIGRYRDSEHIARDLVAHFRQGDDDIELTISLNVLMYALMNQGQYAEGRTIGEEVVLRSKELDIPEVLAPSMGNLGYLEFLDGNPDKAQEIYLELVADHYSLERTPIGYAFGMNNLGEFALAKGDWVAAKDYFQKAYDTFKQARHKRGIAFTLNNLGGVCTAVGELELAKEHYHKAYHMNKEIADQAGLGHSLSAMANVAIWEHNYDEAYRYFNEALKLREINGDRAGYARSLTEVGMTLYLLGRGSESLPLYEESLQIAEELSNKQLFILSYMGIGAIHLLDGDHDKAIINLKQMINMMEQESFTPGVVMIAAMTASILSDRDMDEEAARLVGYVKQNQVEFMRAFTQPILENVEYTLRNRMGASYLNALDSVQDLDLDEIYKLVRSA